MAQREPGGGSPFADVDRGVPAPVASFGSAAVATLAPAETEVEPEPDLVVDHEPEVEAAPVPEATRWVPIAPVADTAPVAEPEVVEDELSADGDVDASDATIAPAAPDEPDTTTPAASIDPIAPAAAAGAITATAAKPQVDFWQEPTLKPKKGWRAHPGLSSARGHRSPADPRLHPSAPELTRRTGARTAFA